MLTCLSTQKQYPAFLPTSLWTYSLILRAYCLFPAKNTTPASLVCLVKTDNIIFSSKYNFFRLLKRDLLAHLYNSHGFKLKCLHTAMRVSGHVCWKYQIFPFLRFFYWILALRVWYFFFFILSLGYKYKSVREYRRGSKTLIIQGRQYNRTHRMKTNKTKTQHNMCQSPLPVNKHNTICASHHYL
jgi:hypothetical protein